MTEARVGKGLLLFLVGGVVVGVVQQARIAGLQRENAAMDGQRQKLEAAVRDSRMALVLGRAGDSEVRSRLAKELVAAADLLSRQQKLLDSKAPAATSWQILLEEQEIQSAAQKAARDDQSMSLDSAALRRGVQ